MRSTRSIIRAVVDTQIWFRSVISPHGPSARVLEAYRAGRFMVVASAPLLDELEDVLRRPKLVKKFNLPPEAVDLVTDLRRRADLVAIDGSVQLCRDPKDDMFLETALRGRAQALVSEDKDLSDDPALGEHLATWGISILTVQRFLREIEEER